MKKLLVILGLSVCNCFGVVTTTFIIPDYLKDKVHFVAYKMSKMGNCKYKTLKSYEMTLECNNDGGALNNYTVGLSNGGFIELHDPSIGTATARYVCGATTDDAKCDWDGKNCDRTDRLYEYGVHSTSNGQVAINYTETNCGNNQGKIKLPTPKRILKPDNCTENNCTKIISRFNAVNGNLDLNKGDAIITPYNTPNNYVGSKYMLIMQDDGNLVEYACYDNECTTGVSYYATGTSQYGSNYPQAHAILQNDGNFVVYKEAGVNSSNAVWNAGVYSGINTSFELQIDGNIVIHSQKDSTGSVVWSSSSQGGLWGAYIFE